MHRVSRPVAPGDKLTAKSTTFAAMQCIACGESSQTPGADCTRCGRTVPGKCPECGFVNMQSVNFCGGCGRLLDAMEAKHPGPRGRTPEEREARPEFEKQHKDVTVLFADIRGSLEVIRGLEPENAQQILNGVLHQMIEAVHEYDGRVSQAHQVLGDGIVALFGAPDTHEDHAVRACLAALAMQKKVEMHNATPAIQKKGESQNKVILIRVGLHSGSVAVTDNDLGLKYRAVGETVHMAARMERNAPPGAIRASSATHDLVKGFISSNESGWVHVKGLKEPVKVFSIDSALTHNRFEVKRSRGLNPLVAREDELAILNEAFSAVERGAPHVVLVSGEAGIGKSRLVHEFLEGLGSRKTPVLQTVAVPYGQRPLFSTLREILRSILGIDADDRDDVAQGKLDAWLSVRDPAAAKHAAALRGLISLSAADRYREHQNPIARRREIFEAVDFIIDAHGKTGVRIMVLEDAHWSDNESLAWIGHLNNKPPAGCLVIVTCRTELELPRVDHTTRAPLENLSKQDTLKLVKHLVKDKPGNDDMYREIAERSGGNPLFVEESVSMFGEARLPKGDKFSVAPNIKGLIASRMDRLAPEVRTVLRCAAVIGDETDGVLLRATLRMDDERFREVCNLAVEAGTLLKEGKGRVRFRHLLFRDTLYQNMLPSLRRELHGHVVDAIEETYKENLDEHVDALAEHCYRAGRWSGAASYYRNACLRTQHRQAYRDAIRCFERGIEAHSQMPEGERSARLGVMLRLTVTAAMLPAGAVQRMLRILEEALVLIKELDDERQLCNIYNQLSTAYWMTSRHEEALRAGERAQDLAEKTGNGLGLIAARYNIGMAHHARGDFSQAHRQQQGVIDLIDRLDGTGEMKPFGWSVTPGVITRLVSASSLVFLGDFERAKLLFEQGIDLADQREHHYSRSIIREEYGFGLILQGRPGEAVRVLEPALDIAEENEVMTMLPACIGSLGHALALCGRSEEALALMTDRYEKEKVYRLGGNYAHNYLLFGLTTAHLHAGDVESARRYAHQAEEMTRDRGERAFHAFSLELLARTYMQHDPGNAMRHLEQALEISEACNMAPLRALCLGSLARASQLRGDEGDEARAETLRSEAARAWRELGAECAAGRAERGVCALTAE